MRAKWLVVAIAGILILGLSVAIWSQECQVPAQTGEGHCARAGAGPGCMAQLTDEQRELLKAKVVEMREQDASWGEIKEAIREMMQSWGIEAAERPAGHGGHKAGWDGHKAIWQQLTSEQREELKAKFGELKEQEASREEIHEAVQALFEGWGLKPECPQE
jgi:cell division protein FtsN